MPFFPPSRSIGHSHRAAVPAEAGPAPLPERDAAFLPWRDPRRSAAGAKKASAVLSIRTMGSWDTGDADILPQAAALRLGRDVVVVRAGMTDQRFPGGTSGPSERAGEPIRLRLHDAHWTVADRAETVPANGDCFYHSLLLATGASDWCDPAAVMRLRTGIAGTVARHFEVFSPFLPDLREPPRPPPRGIAAIRRTDRVSR